MGLWVLAALLALLWCVGVAHADTIRLKREASVRRAVVDANGVGVGATHGSAAGGTSGKTSGDGGVTSGGGVTLADVAWLEGPYAQQLGTRVVAAFPAGVAGGMSGESSEGGGVVATEVVTLSQVRDALTANGVNWAKLSLKGVPRCEVTLLAPVTPVSAAAQGESAAQDGAAGLSETDSPPSTSTATTTATTWTAAGASVSAEPGTEPASALTTMLTAAVAQRSTASAPPAGWDAVSPETEPTIAAAVDHPVTTSGALTVRGLVAERIERLLGVPGERLILRFRSRDEAVLNMSTVAARFEVEPVGAPRRGRLSLKVRRITGLGQAEAFEVTAMLSRRVMAVVATAPVSRGELFTVNNVALRPAVIDDTDTLTVTAVNSVLGAVASTTLREGDVVTPAHLAPAKVIRRGDLVSVHVAAGAVSLEVDGFAQGDGSVGQTVQIRLDRRRSRDARVVTAVVVGPGRVQVTTAGSGHGDFLAIKE